MKDSEAILKRLDEMVRSQIEARGILDPRVLQAMRKVPRPLFIPPELRAYAFDDGPVAIGHDQTISQPYIVAFMTEALNVRPGDRVLEIGTGSGYQTAVLCEMGAEVYSVECLRPLHEKARRTLRELGYSGAHLRLGNGRLGWPENAPFDKILVTAAAGDKIPDTLADQLRDGGTMIIPVGDPQQWLILGVQQGGFFKKTETIPVRFVPLVGDDEAKEAAQEDRRST